jgi:hypothetical protein
VCHLSPRPLHESHCVIPLGSIAGSPTEPSDISGALRKGISPYEDVAGVLALTTVGPDSLTGFMDVPPRNG